MNTTLSRSALTAPASHAAELAGSVAKPSITSPANATWTIPRQLWARQGAIVLATLLTAVFGFMAHRTSEGVVQTIGRDTVPSIVAAENIRTTLADAHTQLIDAFLAPGSKERQDTLAAFDRSIDQADDSLVAASQNITYGEQERRPIMAIMTNLAAYQVSVGTALGAGNGSSPSTSLSPATTHALDDADERMRTEILPAAARLDEANFVHMADAYNTGLASAHRWLLGFALAAALLAGVLVETQLRLRQLFRRQVNPAMALGLAVTAICALAFFHESRTIAANLRVAKEDAFDSIHALSKAQALAFVANAEESIYLLEHGRAQAQAVETGRFMDTAGQLLSVDMSAADVARFASSDALLQRFKGKGLLGDEMANITFTGEKIAARKTLLAWSDYLVIDRRIRSLEEAGRHAEAVALCSGRLQGQSDWAFDQFTQALRETLQINQSQFGLATDRAFWHARLQWLLLGALVLASLAGSALGLRPRLAEFRA